MLTKIKHYSTKQESIEEALVAPYFSKKPKYVEGQGPVIIKSSESFKVPLADFKLFIKDNSVNPWQD